MEESEEGGPYILTTAVITGGVCMLLAATADSLTSVVSTICSEVKSAAEPLTAASVTSTMMEGLSCMATHGRAALFGIMDVGAQAVREAKFVTISD